MFASALLCLLLYRSRVTRLGLHARPRARTPGEPSAGGL